MEISPVPRRRPLARPVRALLLLAVLMPVVLLVVVPTMLGLQRYVISNDSMAGSIDRGSLVLERSVPASSLQVGDVITFRPPTPYTSQGLVTHRVVVLDGMGARTQGDADDRVDPWKLSLDQPMVTVVVFHVPWIGYPFLGVIEPHEWLALGVLPLLGFGVVITAMGERRRVERQVVAVRTLQPR